MCARSKFFGRQLFASLQYQARQWGEGAGAAERQQGRKVAFASTNMCGGLLVFKFLNFICFRVLSPQNLQGRFPTLA